MSLAREPRKSTNQPSIAFILISVILSRKTSKLKPKMVCHIGTLFLARYFGVKNVVLVPRKVCSFKTSSVAAFMVPLRVEMRYITVPYKTFKRGKGKLGM